MIPVTPQAEPPGFDAAVRKPGHAFLVATPNPSSKDFTKRGSYWKNAAIDLHTAYSGVCAYSCFYMPPPATIDHFLPKSTRPMEAYEWSNFRLCSHRLNLHKGASTAVIDPFVVQPGWFVLDFPGCLVKPGTGLNAVLTAEVAATIDALCLNSDDNLVQERCDLMMHYARGEITLPFLVGRYPFLAVEIERQGIQNTVAQIFKTR